MISARSEAERLKILASNVLDKARRRAGLRCKDVADRLGVTKPRVSAVLSGSENLSLESLAAFALACGARLDITIRKA